MQQKPIDLTDAHRLLAGDTPWTFLVEVALRAVFTYLLIMFAMRLLGKRMAAQLSLFELSMVVTLAAAVGVALEVPDRGELPPVLILAAVIALQRSVSLLGLRKRWVERLTTGGPVMLAQEGRLLLDAMRSAVLSREKVYAVLRGHGVQHLGQVERLYLEASGDFSILKARHPRPGLSIIPECDQELRRLSRVPGELVCVSCGCSQKRRELPADTCSHCECSRWVEAARELEE